MSDPANKSTLSPAAKIGRDLAREAGDAQVMLVLDQNHFRMDELIAPFLNPDFWKAVQAKGYTALGIELLNPGDQPVLDAYMQGRISRDEFLFIYRSEEQNAGNSQITGKRYNKVMSGIADLIDHGIAVYGMDNMAPTSSDPFFDIHKNNDRRILDAQRTSERKLAYIEFRRSYGERINTDPHGVLNDILIQKQKDRRPRMTEDQKDHVSSIMGRPDYSTEDRLEAIYSLFFYRPGPKVSTPFYQTEQFGEPNLSNNRLDKDYQVAWHAEQIVKSGHNLVLFYGAAHSKKNGLPDLLALRGIKNIAISPSLGEDMYECRLASNQDLCTFLEDKAKENGINLKEIMMKTVSQIKPPHTCTIPDVREPEMTCSRTPSPTPAGMH